MYMSLQLITVTRETLTGFLPCNQYSANINICQAHRNLDITHMHITHIQIRLHTYTHVIIIRNKYNYMIHALCMHARTHPYIHTHIHTHTYIHTIHTYIHMYRNRQTDIPTDRQTYRQTDRQTDRHTYIHTYMHTYIHTHTYSGVATGGQGGNCPPPPPGSGKWKIRKFAIWGKMTPNYSAVLDFDYQLRRHVRKRNRAMFEQNIFHFSDFFLDKIDFNLDKIDFFSFI